MANTTTTQLPELTVIQNEDWIYVIDKSDLTDSPQGTSKKISKFNLGLNSAELIDNETIAAHPTGDVYTIVTEAKTYTDWGGIVVPSNTLAVLIRLSGVFSSSQTDLDLTDYVQVTDLSSNLNSTSTTEALNLAGAKVLNDSKASKEEVAIIKDTVISDLPLYTDIINAVNGWIVNFKNAITKSGIPSYSTGTFNAEFNQEAFDLFGVKNVVKLTAIGNEAPWQNYLCVQITKQDLINAGADFDANNVFVSMKFITKQTNANHHFILRYGTPLDFTMNTSTTDSDAIFYSGGQQGLADGDATTFATKVDTKEYLGVYTAEKLENLKVPAVYKGKDFVGIMMALRNPNNSNTTPNEQMFIAPAVVVGSTIDSWKNYTETVEILADNTELPFEKFYAACGDSITNANHTGITDIEIGDLYMPFDGYTEVSTYKRKGYPYYIAQKNRLQWANYGWGGSTLIQCTASGVSKNGFATPSGKYTQLKEGVVFDYISMFYGWNDSYFGVVQQIEIWLNATYGGGLYYPDTPEKVGTSGYANQTQLDAVNAYSSSISGTTYTGWEYFKMMFIGNIDSTDVKTWFGAWNTVLPYFMIKYPNAKILLIVPYHRADNDGPSTLQRDAVIAVANKFGLPYYDFRERCKAFEPNGVAITGYPDIQNFRQTLLTSDTLHPNNNGYKYIFPSIGDKLMNI